jgi:hypothetical protein
MQPRPLTVVTMMTLRLKHTPNCEPDAWASATGRKRVLVEGPDSWALAEELESAGYEVAICHGPEGNERCPLLVSNQCAAAAGADAIVSALPAADGDPIVRALADAYPNTPVVVEAPQYAADRYPTARRVIETPLSTSDVLDALGEVLGD